MTNVVVNIIVGLAAVALASAAVVVLYAIAWLAIGVLGRIEDNL